MPALSEIATAQPRAVRLFERALAGGRLHHAYLLCGPEESRPFALASAVAAALVCSRRRDEPERSDACGECPACRRMAAGTHPDTIRLTPDRDDALSIDAIRDLTRRLSLSPVEAPMRVALIDAADQMLPATQNALLKTLEEPPGSAVILLATARPRMLLITVRSRCQRVSLAPLPRLGASAALSTTGLPAPLCRILAALVGGDSEAALRLAGADPEQTHAALLRVLAPQSGAARLMQAAGELAGEREQADRALAFLEVLLRDALAERHGAARDLCYTLPDDAPLAGVPSARLSAAAARLQSIRRYGAVPFNRAFALQTLLLDLHGVLAGETALA